MILRAVLGLVGLIEVVWPRRTVDFWMDRAAADGPVELRPWVYTAARLEGLVLLLWAVTRADPTDG